MKNKKNKRALSIVLLLLLVVFVSVGYAALSSTLNIGGSSEISEQTWDVHFENLTGANASSSDVTVTKAAAIKESTTETKTDDKTIEFEVSFKKPGDKYTFNVDVVNAGSLPANAKVEVTGLDTAADEWLNWTVTGLSDSTTEVLAANGGKKTLTVTVEFDPTKTTLPTDKVTASLAAKVTAVQD